MYVIWRELQLLTIEVSGGFVDRMPGTSVNW